ncbi:MAG TPA: hypothetical protein ENK66_09260 [Arcobacter sp.]|jgi:lysophospholipase L1-like esterase|nr:hypothetical protein [Arcobacter sp.]
MPKTNITFIGDSFVEGYGDPLSLGWVGRVCQYSKKSNPNINLQITNLGIRGETSGDILNRYNAVITKEQLNSTNNIIVLSFGTNDCIQYYFNGSVDIQKSIKNMVLLITKAKEDFDTVLFVLPPCIAETDINKRIKELIDVYIPILESLNVKYINLYETLLDNEIWQYETAKYDGAHPRENGYEEFAKLIFQDKNWIL